MATSKQSRCSFCGRPQNEVQDLVGSPPDGPFICNNCLDASQQAIVAKRGSAGGRKKNEDFVLPKPRAIYGHLSDYVIGQERAKRTVANAVYSHFKRRKAVESGVDLGVEISKSNILLLGPSGTGKTEIARSIAKILRVPFHVSDVSNLTQAGYVGDDVESIIQGLLGACDNDVEQAQWGVVFLDEMDKIARKSGRNASGYRDVTGEGVQQQLLKLVEGHKVKVPHGMARMVSGVGQGASMVDTTNILFICGGSFDGIQETVKKRVNKGTRLGFGAEARKDLNDRDIYSQIEDEDLLEFGLIPELLGRLPVVTSTLPLTNEEMLRILTEPKNAIVKQFQALWKLEDEIDLQFQPDTLERIAEMACKSPKGARALRSILESALSDYSFDYPSESDIESVLVTPDVIDGTGEPVVTRRGTAALNA